MQMTPQDVHFIKLFALLKPLMPHRIKHNSCKKNAKENFRYMMLEYFIDSEAITTAFGVYVQYYKSLDWWISWLSHGQDHVSSGHSFQHKL